MLIVSLSQANLIHCHTQQGFFLQGRGQAGHLTPMEVPRVTLQGSAFKTAAPVSTGETSAPGLIILDSCRGMMSLDQPSGTSQENSCLGKRQ